MQTKLYFTPTIDAFRKSVKEPIFSWRLLNAYAVFFFNSLKLLHGKILHPLSVLSCSPPKHHPYVCFSRFELLITELIDFFTWPLISLDVLRLKARIFFVVDVGAVFSSLLVLCFRARPWLPPPSPLLSFKSPSN